MREWKKALTWQSGAYQYNAIMVTVAFKATEELDEFIRQEAAARKTSVSAFIRAAINKMKPRQRARMVRKNGHYVAVLPPGSPPITDEIVNAAEEEYWNSL